jgi:hypothetical protein
LVEWVFYHPPKSSAFGHGSRFRDPQRTWECLKDFLAKLTDAEAPLEIDLSCRAASKWLREEVANARLREAETRFGAPNRSDPVNGAHWALAPEQLEDAVSFELGAAPATDDSLPPSGLHFHYRFHWRIPGQPVQAPEGGTSRLGVRLQAGAFLLQPGFVFTASLDAPAFREQLIAVEAAAPFRLSDLNFKRWLLPEDGKSNGRYLKPDRDWRKRWIVT